MSHLRELQHATHREMMKSPEFAAALPAIVERMQRDFPRQLIDSIVQKYRDDIDIYDAYAFYRIYEMIDQGKLAITLIDIGRTPRPDDARQANNESLAMLPEPFLAEFIGGTGNGRTDDGAFCWTEPVTMIKTVDGEEIEVRLPPMSVPLEVGTTASSRTLSHLRDQPGRGGLARWPYHSTAISLFWFDRGPNRGPKPCNSSNS
jgi:hypothetical protein